MIIETRHFGRINIEEEKIITFEQGIMGFAHMKKFTLLYDLDQGQEPLISWLQSLENKDFALPVVNPSLVEEQYNPIVADELLLALGELKEENLAVLITVTLSKDITDITCNLKAPLVINTVTKKGCQVIVENEEYGIKHNMYDTIRRIRDDREVQSC